ncbi:MAG: SAM-dependent DNA methyltransferase, partial [Cyanothece sp. SIO1E1]|nr:SAM-dependent DNA methyltransferase [Cyanothece sp. SIO1E1]
RKSVERYSYVATLEEIQENDYNLNIPRYVDTFEEEAPVDLVEISSSLKQLNQEMEETDKAIAEFCTELGIQTPF